MFGEKINKDISIKDIFKNIDEFYQEISKIDKICFTSRKRDLFSKFGRLETCLADNYGMEEPEEFSIQAKYGRSLTQKIKSSIANLKQQENVQKLIIKGLDDQGFEKIFNEGNFIQKMPVRAEKGKNGLWSDIIVKSELIEKLGLH